MICVLFLASNPKYTTRLSLDRESRIIADKIRQSDLRDNFEFRQEWAVRVKDIEGHLLYHKPTVVHFSGHGGASGEIIVEDEMGNEHPVAPRALSRLFASFTETTRCVILNACYSQAQAEAIAQHVDCVIGMSKAISDDAALSFSAAFYQALGYGKDIETAFELGCVQLDMENLGEEEIPTLIAKKRSPREIILVEPKKQALASAVKILESKVEEVTVHVFLVSSGESHVVVMPLDALTGKLAQTLAHMLKADVPFERSGLSPIYYFVSKTQLRELDNSVTLRQNGVQNKEMLGLYAKVQAG